MYNYTPLTNLATSTPAIVARSVIASRNSDPPSENLTNTAVALSRVTLPLNHYMAFHCQWGSFLRMMGPFFYPREPLNPRRSGDLWVVGAGSPLLSDGVKTMVISQSTVRWILPAPSGIMDKQ